MQREYRTKAKDEIMSFFIKYKDKSFSATQIHQMIVVEGGSINLATVYRNLEKMTKSGKLKKIKNSKDDYSVFQLLNEDGSCDAHLHVQCGSCGSMIHLDHEGMELIGSYLNEKCGYTLDCKDSVLIGSCEECSKTR